MDEQKLRKLLKKEEGPKLDFKQKLELRTESQKKEFSKDIIAIANSRGGRGYIIYGVQDKTKKIIGVNTNYFSEEKFQQIIYNRCDPPIPINVEQIEIDNKSVVVITIYAESHKPHQMIQNGTFYIRRGSTTDIARRSEIANMLQENGLFSYETVILKNVTTDELDSEQIEKYLKNMGIIADTNNNLLLESLGIIAKTCNDDFRCTIGGILVFGKRPDVFLPHTYTKIMYKGSVEYFSGNILNQLDKVSYRLREIIDDFNYPIVAIEEAIANALVHRDYLDYSRGIFVTITEKNIEISNPGALMAGNSVYKYIKERNPERRNPWLYQRLLMLDDKKRFMKTGIGMDRMKKAFEDYGKVKFVNIGSQNLFKVIFPR